MQVHGPCDDRLYVCRHVRRSILEVEFEKEGSPPPPPPGKAAHSKHGQGFDSGELRRNDRNRKGCWMVLARSGMGMRIFHPTVLSWHLMAS